MPFEEIDNKAREAADLHHPTYHEDAWARMEKLLDEHLPQKKEKKRRFIFWWLVPLLMGGAAITIWQPWKQTNPIAKNDSKPSGTTSAVTDINTPSQKKDKIKEIAGTNTTVSTNTDALNNIIETKDKTASVTKGTSTGLLVSNKPANRNNIFTEAANRIVTVKSETNPIAKKPAKSTYPQLTAGLPGLLSSTANKTDAEKNDRVMSENKPAPVLNTIDNNSTQAATEISNNTDKKEQSAVATATAAASAPVAIAEKKENPSSVKKKKPNYFFLTFSAGPDVSFVSGNKTGTSQIIGGAGIGYSIKDKIVLRTGFYSGHKVYSASGDSYHGNAAFYQYYPYLEKVNADCKIYEIPVSVSFNFAKRKEHNFFASAGVSSLLMKKENYNYFYKYTATGTTHEKAWSVNNGSKHFFSVLSLSGGYQHSIGKRMVFMAEPYIKMPLSGVGLGKVKLGSTGILFTVGIKPF